MIIVVGISTTACNDKSTHKVKTESPNTKIVNTDISTNKKIVDIEDVSADTINSTVPSSQLIETTDDNTNPTSEKGAETIDQDTKKGDKKRIKKKTNSVKKYYPIIAFDQTNYEFGEIVAGDIVKYDFRFTNTGKANLEIFSASASCGCTKPSFPFLDIKPGETGFIGVVYNSVSKEGAQTPEITLETNAYPSTIMITMSGIVTPKKEEKTIDSVKVEVTKIDSTVIDTTKAN